MTADPNFCRYRGRLAPTPSGYLHRGNLATFAKAIERAEEHPGGEIILRIEDIDLPRCKPKYTAAIYEDLKAAGLYWTEGPDCPGAYEPYVQSERYQNYLDIWRVLCWGGFIYPSPHSRRDIQKALSCDKAGKVDRDPIFPKQFRTESWDLNVAEPGEVNWRFKVPDGRKISFYDQALGPISYVAGEDFGDFIVWRRDGLPSYELAVVVDDYDMAITEVVRGEDLLLSTARQLLLYEALNWTPPAFYHCPLLYDEMGKPLSKRIKSIPWRAQQEVKR